MALHQSTTLPSYGHCDSYFVENHDDDDGYYARAAIERERTRALNKIRQRQFAEELSRLTADEYEDDILDHMEMMEAETMPDINSIEIQTEIQWFMRPYLLDFLLEAHHAFQLLPETLFLAINLLDRYCSRRVVYKRHYQLVGCSALLIAAKYGDRKDRVPTIRELKSMCCSLYDDDMFTQMEWHVLQTVNWIIGHPTVPSFLDIALGDAPVDAELQNMVLYIAELSLYHKEFIPVLPSILARSALTLARCILGRQQTADGSWEMRYDPNVVMDLSGAIRQPSHALFRKYSTPQFSHVASTIEAFLHHQAMLARQAAERAQQARQAQEAARQVYAKPEQPQDSPMSMVDSCVQLTPQTPQKPHYPHTNMINGVMTPPITPDKDFQSQQSYAGTQQNLLPRLTACVPTPPSSMSSHLQYSVPAYPQQYVQ